MKLQRPGQRLVVHGPHVTIERRDIGHCYHLDWWTWTALEPGPVAHTGWYRIVARPEKPGQTLTWSVQ